MTGISMFVIIMIIFMILFDLAAGGIPDKRWPPYASSVIIELWEPHDRNPNGDPTDRNPDDDEVREEPLVRVIYNGRPVPVAVCQPRKALIVQEEGFNEWCPFSKWQVQTKRSFVDVRMITFKKKKKKKKNLFISYVSISIRDTVP
jgi:hypothetical protein